MRLPRHQLLASVFASALLAGCTSVSGDGEVTDPYALETLALVAERMDQLRGLDGGEGPEVSLIDQDDLPELVDELLAEPEWRESVEHERVLYTLLGLVPEDIDLIDLVRQSSIDGIAGLYRPELDRYYVRMIGEYSSFEESTSSHEYAHYLQDRHFDLETIFGPPGENRDREFAVRALVEGEATYLEELYLAEYFNDVQAFGAAFGGVLAAAEGESVPLALARETEFVYLDGSSFVRGLLESGTKADELFERPPATTEQVLHPRKYRANEEGEDVASILGQIAFPARWAAGASNVLGELQLRTWLEDIGAGSEADSAAAGWGGDAYWLLTAPGGEDALLARIHWDTQLDLEQFLNAVERGLEDDRRYELLDCGFCDYRMWDGPAGVLGLGPASEGSGGTLLVVAPSVGDVDALIALAR